MVEKRQGFREIGEYINEIKTSFILLIHTEKRGSNCFWNTSPPDYRETFFVHYFGRFLSNSDTLKNRSLIRSKKYFLSKIPFPYSQWSPRFQNHFLIFILKM